jgi:hypothetical protein
MHKRERHLAMLNDNRVVRPFEWGAEFITEDPRGADPHELFAAYSAKTIANSDEYFAIPESFEYRLQAAGLLSEPRLVGVATGDLSEPGAAGAPAKGSPSGVEDATGSPRDIASTKGNPVATAPGSDSRRQVLSWTSSITTPSVENNTAYATYFPHETNTKAAVIILPHWNAKAGSYFDLCKFFNKVGLASLRLTLPYHEERMPAELERADYLVGPNVGRSLQSIRQSVADTRACVLWLKQQGYEKIGIVGTSIGSCVAFLAFVHDRAIDAAVFNHVSGYMADVTWHGLSTYHVRHGFGDNIELDELREYWLPVSPMAYMEKLAAQPPRPQRYIYTLYDLSFPVELSRETMRALRRHKIKHSKAAIPCGHYTLGEKPWVYLDGYKIIKFLHKNLK